MDNRSASVRTFGHTVPLLSRVGVDDQGNKALMNRRLYVELKLPLRLEPGFEYSMLAQIQEQPASEPVGGANWTLVPEDRWSRDERSAAVAVGAAIPVSVELVRGAIAPAHNNLVEDLLGPAPAAVYVVTHGLRDDPRRGEFWQPEHYTTLREADLAAAECMRTIRDPITREANWEPVDTSRTDVDEHVVRMWTTDKQIVWLEKLTRKVAEPCKEAP